MATDRDPRDPYAADLSDETCYGPEFDDDQGEQTMSRTNPWQGGKAKIDTHVLRDIARNGRGLVPIDVHDLRCLLDAYETLRDVCEDIDQTYDVDQPEPGSYHESYSLETTTLEDVMQWIHNRRIIADRKEDALRKIREQEAKR